MQGLAQRGPMAPWSKRKRRKSEEFWQTNKLCNNPVGVNTVGYTDKNNNATVCLYLITSRRWSRVRMASRLASSTWLCWASLRLWASLCSWLWAWVRRSSSSLRRETSSLQSASRFRSCCSKNDARCLVSSSCVWRSERSAARHLVCLSSSFSWLYGGEGERWEINRKPAN